jgi:hypothetical protein
MRLWILESHFTLTAIRPTLIVNGGSTRSGPSANCGAAAAVPTPASTTNAAPAKSSLVQPGQYDIHNFSLLELESSLVLRGSVCLTHPCAECWYTCPPRSRQGQEKRRVSVSPPAVEFDLRASTSGVAGTAVGLFSLPSPSVLPLFLSASSLIQRSHQRCTTGAAIEFIEGGSGGPQEAMGTETAEQVCVVFHRYGSRHYR